MDSLKHWHFYFLYRDKGTKTVTYVAYVTNDFALAMSYLYVQAICFVPSGAALSSYSN